MREEHPEQPPRYTRYRARRRLIPEREAQSAASAGAHVLPRPRARGRTGGGGEREGWRRWTTPKRILLVLGALILGWLALSVLLFLISSHFERTPPPSNVSAVLDPAGFPLTSANNILVLGSDRRQKNSKEPGANTSGPSRSDSIMLIRTGG